MWHLRRPENKREFKFSELQQELAGAFFSDPLPIDRRLVENNQCPQKNCRNFLAYKGVSNSEEYRAYGVCERCDYARLFWSEGTETAAAKKSLLPKAA
jgi:hypothetical protein